MKHEDIEKLVNLLEKSSLTEIKWKDGESEIELRKPSRTSETKPVFSPPAQSTEYPADSSGEKATKIDSDDFHKITSPMVGLFHIRPSSKQPDFVKTGDKVKEGQTICIIEAMKMMNGINSDVNGVVEKVCVHNETLVEYGTELFHIRKDT